MFWTLTGFEVRSGEWEKRLAEKKDLHLTGF